MIKRQYEEDGYLITEYENGTITKRAISVESDGDPIIPEPTIEEQILFETQYQTLLLEMGMI